MTILLLFHRSNYRTVKHFYNEYVCVVLRDEFPQLVSYHRFIELVPGTLVPFCAYLRTRRGDVTGIAFVDSTPLKVCHNRRIHAHNVFKELAKRGNTSVGWFLGFKLHLIINEKGELLAIHLTSGNVDDRRPVPDLTKGLYGKFFGEKGYISQKLFDLLYDRGLQLITKIKKHMKNRLMPVIDKILTRKRAIIETVNDQLKNISPIEHTRHRSVTNAMVNVIAGVVAYTYQEKLPSLKISKEELNRLYAATNVHEPLSLPIAAF